MINEVMHFGMITQKES